MLDSLALNEHIEMCQLQLKLEKTDAYLSLVQCQLHVGLKGAKIFLEPWGI
jgi:hypothetical protein